MPRRSKSPSPLDAATQSDDDYLEQLGYRPELKRTLGLFSSFALQFGNIAPIGGIVFTIGVALSTVGPATMWPWLIAGALQMLIAFCVAEACSSFPIAGAAYSIVSRLGGRMFGWQTGWWIEIAHIVSVSGSCVAIAPIVASWLGFNDLSHWWTVGVTGILILISTLINVISVKWGARFVNAGVFATIIACILVSVILAGALIFGHSPVHGIDYLFTTQGTVTGSVALPLLFAALLPCIVLNGFDVSGNASEETMHASRSVPRGMVIANGSSYLFGTVVILLLVLGMRNVPDTINAAQPVTFILKPILGAPVAKVFEVLAVYGLFVSAVVLQMAGARVVWAQARDGEFPMARAIGRLNREKVPAVAVWMGGVVAFLLVLWSALYAVLIAMTVVLWVAGYGLLIGCMFVGKLRGVVPKPALEVKAWRVLFPIAILWSIVIAVVLIYQNPVQVGIGLLIVAAVGMAIYFFALPRGQAAERLVAEHAAERVVEDPIHTVDL
jgi:amino acid transporter